MTTPKNPGGRPTTEPADARIDLRLPMRKKSAWVKAAQREGMSLSAWIARNCDARAKS